MLSIILQDNLEFENNSGHLPEMQDILFANREAAAFYSLIENVVEGVKLVLFHEGRLCKVKVCEPEDLFTYAEIPMLSISCTHESFIQKFLERLHHCIKHELIDLIATYKNVHYISRLDTKERTVPALTLSLVPLNQYRNKQAIGTFLELTNNINNIWKFMTNVALTVLHQDIYKMQYHWNDIIESETDDYVCERFDGAEEQVSSLKRVISDLTLMKIPYVFVYSALLDTNDIKLEIDQNKLIVPGQSFFVPNSRKKKYDIALLIVRDTSEVTKNENEEEDYQLQKNRYLMITYLYKTDIVLDLASFEAYSDNVVMLSAMNLKRKSDLCGQDNQTPGLLANIFVTSDRTFNQ